MIGFEVKCLFISKAGNSSGQIICSKDELLEKYIWFYYPLKLKPKKKNTTQEGSSIFEHKNLWELEKMFWSPHKIFNWLNVFWVNVECIHQLG